MTEPPKTPLAGRAAPAVWSRAAAIDRATVLFRAGHAGAARSVLEALVAARPDDAVAWNNLGNIRLAAGDTAAAVADYRRAAGCGPDYADAHANLGHALARDGAPEAAAAAVRRALALRPAFPEAEVTLGYALSRLGRIDEAIACCRRALALRSDSAEAHWNLALLLLLTGAEAEGWAEYEWRWRNPNFAEPRRTFAAPAWCGEPAEALRGPLLVYAEQGLGDTIQFCRYAPQLAASGYRVVLEVQPALVTLLWSSFAGIGVAVVARPPLPGPTMPPVPVAASPRYAAHVALMSLPARLGAATAAVPYLAAEPHRAARWRRRLGDGFTLGLAWHGSATLSEDRDRSFAAEKLAPLAAVAGIRLVSLQCGADEDRATLGGREMLALGPDFVDFAETAAAVANLDLVVSVDTAVAHLAGALGRPVWLLLPFAPDWRWRLGRADTPWYPTMRLYRQTRRGDWDDVIARVVADLVARIGAAAAPSGPGWAIPGTPI